MTPATYRRKLQKKRKHKAYARCVKCSDGVLRSRIVYELGLGQPLATTYPAIFMWCDRCKHSEFRYWGNSSMAERQTHTRPEGKG